MEASTLWSSFPVKARCPSVGECQGREVGPWGGVWAGRGGGGGGGAEPPRRNRGRGVAVEVGDRKGDNI